MRTQGLPLLGAHSAVPALFLVDTFPLWGALAGHAVADSIRVTAHRDLLRTRLVKGGSGDRVLEALVGASGDGVLLVDGDGTIRQANNAAIILLAGAGRKLAGQRIDTLLPAVEERRPEMRALRRSGRQEVLSVEWRMKAERADGSGSFDALVSGGPVPGAEQLVLVVREEPKRAAGANASGTSGWPQALRSSMGWMRRAGTRAEALHADLEMLARIADSPPSVVLDKLSVDELASQVVRECAAFADERHVTVVSDVLPQQTRVDRRLILHSLRNVALALIAESTAGGTIRITHSENGRGLTLHANRCPANAAAVAYKLQREAPFDEEIWRSPTPDFGLALAGELARSTGARWSVRSESLGVTADVELPGMALASDTIPPLGE